MGKIDSFHKDILTVVNVGDEECGVPWTRGVLPCGAKTIAPCHRLCLNTAVWVKRAYLLKFAMKEIGEFLNGTISVICHLRGGNAATLGMPVGLETEDVVV